MISAATESMPFERDRSSRMVPFLTGILVFLAALAFLAAAILGRAAGEWHDAYTGHLTLQVDAVQEQALNDLLLKLTEDDRIEGFHRLSERQQSELIAPWIGDVALLEGLSLPIIVDIELVSNTDGLIAQVEQDLENSIEGAQVTIAGAWLERLGQLASIVRSAALVALLITLGAVAVMVIAVTRAGLAIHAEAVGLLHMIGATDDWVAKQFQTRMLGSTAMGAAAGMLAAVITLFALRGLAPDGTGSLLMISSSPGLWGWLGTLVLPIAVAGLAAVTTRLTVLSDLKHMM
ncbi:MAG: FtsX-like permease family protein [Alphaproteobacteria bacterium]